jgi:hypothetical protein
MICGAFYRRRRLKQTVEAFRGDWFSGEAQSWARVSLVETEQVN